MDTPWATHIESEMAKPYFATLRQFVYNERATKQIFPENQVIFNAFNLCPYYDLQVVILGGEPYTDGSEHGLAWSKSKGTRPEALNNIFREAFKDEYPQWMRDRFNEGVFGSHYKGNDLTQWARQGVLLLNTCLTAEKGRPGAHKNKGWEEFAANTIKMISDTRKNIVFMFWGKGAEGYADMIDHSRHLVLTSAHPNPHTAGEGFYGCEHFKKAKEYMLKHPHGLKQRSINWFVL